MPQVDLVSVCAGAHNDGKVACETLADDNPPAADQSVDFPPESFFLSKEAEHDWIDRNAFVERKSSSKSSSHFANLNLNPNPNHPSSNSGSQRYSLSVKSKPSFFGLPKTPKAAYAETNHRRPASIRLFPKRSASSSANSRSGKSVVQVTEPSSPKVSCIGRVRSRRDCGRRKKNRENQSAEPTIKRSKSNRSHKTGFWTNFRSIFRSRGHKSAKDDESSRESPSAVAESLKKSKSVRKRDFSGLAAASNSKATSAAEPPGLGAAKRFSSGRRSDAWAVDMEVDGAK